MREVEKICVVMPTWVGDAVMATPTLRALRARFADASITLLCKPLAEPLIEGAPWFDDLMLYDPRRERFTATATRLRERGFDLAVILPNSFRTALLPWLAGIPRRVGYARGLSRSPMLTERLHAKRTADGYAPTPTLDYYLSIAAHLGADAADRSMQLFASEADEQNAARLLGESRGPLVLLNVGANYGAAKMWLPQRFAEVGDRLIKERGATVAVSGSPAERRVIDAVLAAAKEPMIDLQKAGLDLRTLKAVVKRAALMISNDTGPRHIAAAFGTPVVTVFGPTDPVWAEVDFAMERKVIADVFCQPCQLKHCPLDHRCMTNVTVDEVHAAAVELLEAAR